MSAAKGTCFGNAREVISGKQFLQILKIREVGVLTVQAIVSLNNSVATYK
jgi:hypothetical protein